MLKGWGVLGKQCPNIHHHKVECFILFQVFLFAFDVGGLGIEFCVFVAGWRHALRSEWPFMIYYYYSHDQLDS